MNYTVYFAASIIVLLAFTALYYHYLLYCKSSEENASGKAVNKARSERQKHAQKSIHILARCIVEEQVTLTEASMRINGLLNVLRLPDRERSEYAAIDQLAKETSYIPILDDWAKLPKKKQRDFDRERESIEEKYRDFVHHTSKRIVNREIAPFA